MKKIIVVDDEPFIQEVVKRHLEKGGYIIEAFSNGSSFLNHTFTPPDLIILDRKLPDSDGLEICRKLKQDQKTKNIPVIMVSAHPKIKMLAREAGAEASLEKPFSMKILKNMVDGYLDKENILTETAK